MFRTLLPSAVLTAAFLSAAATPQPFQAPMFFEPNRGQLPSDVLWLARGSGFHLGLTSTGATLALRGGGAIQAPTPQTVQKTGHVKPGRSAQATDSSTVTMRLFGSRNWDLSGLAPTGGTSNYFIGNQPEQWHTDIPHYSRVKAAGIYDGIDLVFYGNESALEYDFVVAPGADPGQIQLEFEGAAGLRLDPDAGDLVLTTSSGRELHNGRPSVYQQIGGRKVAVKGGYQVVGGGRARFTLGTYDPAHALIIDPTVVFTTFLGGSDSDEAYRVAVDSAGNSYVAGNTYSNNFPTSGGIGKDSGDIDAFVTKLSPTGAVLFSTYLGGSGVDYGMGIAVDTSGVYVSGHTRSSNFPTRQPIQSFNNDDAFVTKLTSLGNGLVYSTFLGGSDSEYGYGIAVDAFQSAYVVGETFSDDFPVVSGFQKFPGDGSFVPINGFAAKLSPSGTSLIYSTYIGGQSSYDYVSSVAVDSSLAAYMTGETCSKDFPTAGTGATGYPGTCTGFVLKLNPAGDSIAYSTYLVNDINNSTGIALDSAGNAYVVGSVTYGASPQYFQEVFVAKILTSAALGYFRFLRGNDGSSWGEGIAADSSGNVWVVGATTSTSFPLAPPIKPNPYAGFLSKYDANGNGPLYTTLLGAQINGVAVVRPSSKVIGIPTYPLIFTAGYRYTGGTAFANQDAFVVKLNEAPVIVLQP